MPRPQFLDLTDSGFVDSWIAASTGDQGWWRTRYPDEHFRTSLFSADLVALLIVNLLADFGLNRDSSARVLDVGAGRGQLATAISALRPHWSITAVDVRPAPGNVCLPWLVDMWDARYHSWTTHAVDEWWQADQHTPVVVIGHEFLDELPCAFGADHDTAWAERWWPDAQHADLPEIGRARDSAWAAVMRRLTGPGGFAIAVDYGHFIHDRPTEPTLRGFRDGQLTAARTDGSVNLTADVAFDAVSAAACEAGAEEIWSADQATTAQRWLPQLPSDDRAHDNPLADLVARNRQRVFRAAHLGGDRGLGSYWWLVHRVAPNVAV